MRKFRRSTGRRGGKRRRLQWQGASAFFPNQAMADGDVVAFWARVPAGAVDNSGAAIPYIVPDDYTLVRSRLIWVFNTTNGGANVTLPWSIGLGLIDWDGLTDNPLDLGNSIPHPVYDTDEDWIFRNAGPEIYENIVEGSNGVGDVDAYQSRAQRKLSAGKGVLCVIGTASPVTPYAALINATVDVRMLFKEP